MGIVSALVWLGFLSYFFAYPVIFEPWIRYGRRPLLLGVIFISIFYGIGIFQLVRSIRDVRHPERVEQEAKRKAAVRRKHKPLIKLSAKTKGVCLKIFLTLFSLAFISIGVGFGSHAVNQCRKVRSWVEVPAKIVSCGLKSSTSHGKGGSHTTWSVQVTFAYSVGGVDYTGDEFSNIRVSSSDFRAQQEKADRYRPGMVVTAYYNPENPSESVIERVTEVPLFMLGFFAVFAIAGTAMFVWVIRSIFVRDALSGRSFFNRALKPSLPMDVKSFAVFAVFWNVVSWVALGGFLFADAGSRGFSFGMVPLAIFPLVGLVIAAKVIVKLVRYYAAPHFAVTVTCAAFRPGEQMQVTYAYDGEPDFSSVLVEVKSINMDVRSSKDLGRDPQAGVSEKVTDIRDTGRLRMGSFAFVIPSMPAAKRRRWSLVFTGRRGGKRRSVAIEYKL